MKFQIPMGELRMVAQLYRYGGAKRKLYKDAKKIEGGIKLSDVNVGDWYLYSYITGGSTSLYLFGVLYKDSKDNWIVIRDEWTSPNYIRDTDAVNDRKFIIFTNIKGLRLATYHEKFRVPLKEVAKGFWTNPPSSTELSASWLSAKNHVNIFSTPFPTFINWPNENPLNLK